jgi:tetratricopeptide (TPR) repeat protein
MSIATSLVRGAARLIPAVVVLIAGFASAQTPPGPDLQEGQRLVADGKFDEAAAWFKEVSEQHPQNPQAVFMYAYSLHAAGKLEKAIEAHKRAARFPAVRAVATYNLGCAYSLLGRTDEAFEALFVAAEIGQVNVNQWTQDSDLTSLREDPRWTELMSRVRELQQNPLPQALRFWVGQWDVYTKQGVKSGENTITLRDNGRVIYESWRSTSGGVGESFNYFDPVNRKWKQLWVDGSGNVIEMAGTFSGGALRFEGLELHQSGNSVRHRTTLTPMKGGRVRQFIERSRDDGATWNVAYDFIYVPKGEPFSLPTNDHGA